jgi:hypothetical protein
MSSRTQAVAWSEAPATPEAKAARKGDDGQYGTAVKVVKDTPKPEDPQEKLLDLLTNLAERLEAPSRNRRSTTAVPRAIRASSSR